MRGVPRRVAAPGAAADRNYWLPEGVSVEPRGGRPPGRPRIATPSAVSTPPARLGWRSPSGTTEDRNVRDYAAQWQHLLVAAVLRGRPRIATHPSRHCRVQRSGWRPLCWAAEDCNESKWRLAERWHGGGGRPPGRPRIGTPGGTERGRCGRWWPSPSGATEDRNYWLPEGVSVEPPGVRSPFRGGRGSQPPVLHGERHRPRRWRLSPGATEDRNWRSVSPRSRVSSWRSPSGATRDRNNFMRLMEGGGVLTVALEGARGSQRGQPVARLQPAGLAVARGDRESQQPALRGPRPHAGLWRSPPEWPRLATQARTSACAHLAQWRSPSGMAEDRNFGGSSARKVRRFLAVALRGRPRIATTPTSTGVKPRTFWRSPSEAAEDRNVDTFTGGDELSRLAVALRATENRN